MYQKGPIKQITYGEAFLCIQYYTLEPIKAHIEEKDEEGEVVVDSHVPQPLVVFYPRRNLLLLLLLGEYDFSQMIYSTGNIHDTSRWKSTLFLTSHH